MTLLSDDFAALTKLYGDEYIIAELKKNIVVKHREIELTNDIFNVLPNEKHYLFKINLYMNDKFISTCFPIFYDYEGLCDIEIIYSRNKERFNELNDMKKNNIKSINRIVAFKSMFDDERDFFKLKLAA